MTDYILQKTLAQPVHVKGIGVHSGVSASAVSYADDQFSVDLGNGTTLTAEKLLVATGRCTELSGLGVGSVGLDESALWVETDEHLRAGDGLWAVGDVTGRGAFTHIGMYQADIIVADVLGNEHEPASYAALPRVTFTDPEIGATGLTEAQARDAGHDVVTATQIVPHTARGWLHKVGNEGFIKLVADGRTGTLVGATAAGPNGGEVLGLLALAVHAQVPVSKLRTMIWAYPTFHGGVGDALRSLTV